MLLVLGLLLGHRPEDQEVGWEVLLTPVKAQKIGTSAGSLALCPTEPQHSPAGRSEQVEVCPAGQQAEPPSPGWMGWDTGVHLAVQPTWPLSPPVRALIL